MCRLLCSCVVSCAHELSLVLGYCLLFLCVDSCSHLLLNHVIQIVECYYIMLLVNAKSLTQPPDRGIIAMVKSRYRKWYLRYTLRRENLANGIIDKAQQAASDTDEEEDDEHVPVHAAGSPVHHIRVLQGAEGKPSP